MDGGELRPRELTRAEEAIALRDGVHVASRSDVGEKRRDVGFGMSLSFVGLSAAFAPLAFGGDAGHVCPIGPDPIGMIAGPGSG